MEQKIQKSNPLQQYFRAIKLYIKMPSGTSYYGPDVIDFTDTGEVGVLPMTGRDELILKNPDALLNGEALIEVLNSCVPALKNARALLTNDIDALITAIRYATYNDSLETVLRCPDCSHENNFKLNLQYALDNMEFLESEYVVNLDSGLSVFLKPYAFPELIKGLHAKFERDKMVRALESTTITAEQRSTIVKKAFSDVATSKVELIASSISKVVDESKGVNVSDSTFIREFLQNIDKKSIDKIDDQITEINDIGIKRTFTAKCEECDYEWESDIDFNPVNFS